MASYYRVQPSYWTGDRREWNDREKLLGLYVLTCEHRNLEGLYRLPKAYIAADLGWSMKTVEATLKTLIAAGFVEYDPAAEVILVCKALEYQAPATENQIKGAIASLGRVPKTSLWDRFLVTCESHCQSLSDAIRMRSECDAHTARGQVRTRAGDSNSNSNSNSHVGGGLSVVGDRQPPQEGIALEAIK